MVILEIPGPLPSGPEGFVGRTCTLLPVSSQSQGDVFPTRLVRQAEAPLGEQSQAAPGLAKAPLKHCNEGLGI